MRRETPPRGAVMIATMNRMATDFARVGPLVGLIHLLLWLRLLYDLSFQNMA